MKPPRYTWLVLLGLWLLAGHLSKDLRPNEYAGGRSRDARDRALANQSALALMLGEFRTSMSDLLFIKTERYLHNGVAYVPHLTEKLLSVEATLEGADDDHHDHADHLHHEESVETVIPGAQQDYRGWIGRMHRQVKPWRDPALEHQHAEGSELIPWFRMMTLSDPHYVRGYTVGSYWLKQHDLQTAIAFVDEGLQHNPDAFQLHLSRAFLLFESARLLDRTALDRPSPQQREIILQARDAFRKAAQCMEAERPHQWQGAIDQAPGWSGYQETDALSAAQMAVALEFRYGDPQRARAWGEHYLELLPHSKSLQRMLRRN